MATNGVQLYQHPRYRQMLAEWQLYQDLYEGEHSTLTGKYLWYHALERKGDADAGIIRNCRIERTRYLNLEEILVSLLVSIFFRNEGTASKELIAMMGDEIKNVDGKGSSLFTFVKSVGQNVIHYGDTYVSADAFPLAAGSEAQARDRGARPFLELLTPLEVPDWQVETDDPARFGKLNALRREFDVLVPRSRLNSQPETRRVSHELFMDGNKFAVQVYLGELDEQGNVVKDPQGEAVWTSGELIATDLVELPVAYVHCDSWLAGASQEILRHFNLRSNLDNVNYHQGYQKLAAIGVSNDEQRIALSANVVACLPENGDLRAIEAAQAVGLENAVTNSLQNVFNVGLNQLRQIAADSKVGQTADAQSKEREYTTSLVESELQTIETLINQALGYYAEFKGKDGTNCTYTLDKEIEDEDFDKWLRVYGSIKDELASNYPDVNKAAVKKAISQLHLDDEEELLQAVDAAVIKTPEAQADEERQGLLNKFARG